MRVCRLPFGGVGWFTVEGAVWGACVSSALRWSRLVYSLGGCDVIYRLGRSEKSG